MPKKLIYSFLSLTIAFCLAGAVSAQTDDTVIESTLYVDEVEPVLISSDDTLVATDEVTADLTTAEEDIILTEVFDEEELAVVDEELEGIEIEESQTTPSGWGLFWRGIRERVSIITTFDPIKKAEKRIKFAEERQLIAEKILENTEDPKAQERAQKVLDRASKMVEKVSENKDKWLENLDENKERLLKNIAAHEVRREQIFDRIEEKFQERLADNPDLEDKYEKFQELRDKSLERGKGLLNAMEQVPSPVRGHLQRVKERIDQKAEDYKEFREDRQELLGEVKAGDEGAKEELKVLHEERKEEIKENQEKRAEVKERVQEKKEDLREAAEAGDGKAAVQLKVINNTQDIIENKVEQVKERVQERVENRQEVRQKAGEAVKAGEPIFSPGGFGVQDGTSADVNTDTTADTVQ